MIVVSVACGKAPSHTLPSPFIWPFKATARGDARSVTRAARLVPKESFRMAGESLTAWEFY